MNVGGQVTVSGNLYFPSLLTLAGEEHCEAFDTTGEEHCETKPPGVLKQSYERGEGSNEASPANASGQLCIGICLQVLARNYLLLVDICSLVHKDCLQVKDKGIQLSRGRAIAHGVRGHVMIFELSVEFTQGHAIYMGLVGY
eukprot:Gb_28820 [translate_table: standard]